MRSVGRAFLPAAVAAGLLSLPPTSAHASEPAPLDGALLAQELGPTISAPATVLRDTRMQVTGRARPGSTVTVWAHRSGEVSFTPRTIASTRADGTWAAPLHVPSDTAVFARTGSLRSGTVLSRVLWAKAVGPSAATRHQLVALTMGARPGAVAELWVHRAGTLGYHLLGRRTLVATTQVRVVLRASSSFSYYVKAHGVRSPTRAVQVRGLPRATVKDAPTAVVRSAPAAVLPAPARTWASGVFSGHTPEESQEFADWRRRPNDLVTAYLPSDTWELMRLPLWHLHHYGALLPGQRMLYSTALWPATGGSLAEAATGAYDEHFAELARNLVVWGQEDSVMRLGWEFNASFYRWSVVTPEQASDYAAAFRRIVDAMRSVPGQRFTFDWNVLGGEGGIDPVLAYPGDAWVDYIGLDLYDFRLREGTTHEEQWQDLVDMTYGLQWQADLAAARGKPLSFAEWGLVQDEMHPGAGMGDDPTFVREMWRWVATHDTAFECYFDWDTDYGVLYGVGPGGTAFPEASSTYRDLFGSSGA